MKHTYHFQSRARDVAGRVEAWPAQPDASTRVGPRVTKYYYHGGKRVAMRVDESGLSAVYYLHGDHLGSTSLTTDENGAVVARRLYYPYGETRWSEGTLLTDFGFTGQRHDGTGLVFMHARYYHPYLNRFISADTMVPGKGSQAQNRYMYVTGNPLKYNDPSGFCSNDPNDSYYDYECWVLVEPVGRADSAGFPFDDNLYAYYAGFSYEQLVRMRDALLEPLSGYEGHVKAVSQIFNLPPALVAATVGYENYARGVEDSLQDSGLWTGDTW
jgi:RHS repeat-associated protein